MNTRTIIMCVVALLIGMLLANMLENVCGCKKVEGFGISTADGSGIDGGKGRSPPGQRQITNSVLKNFINMTNQGFNEYNPPDDDDSGFACGGYAGNIESVSVSKAVEDLSQICTEADEEKGYNKRAFNKSFRRLLKGYEKQFNGSVCTPADDFDSSGKIEEACNSL